jgi:hypothetical protein
MEMAVVGDSRGGCLYKGCGAAWDSRFLARFQRARNDKELFGFAKDKELVWGGLPKACGHLYA